MNDFSLCRLLGKPLEIDNVRVGTITNLSLAQDGEVVTINVSAWMDSDSIDRMKEYLYVCSIMEGGKG